METQFIFHLDVELPQAIMLTINVHMLHPDIVKGFKSRDCNISNVYCNSRFVYAQQPNGMYTRVSLTC